MKLKVVGSISTSGTPCLKCLYILNPYGKISDIYCENCGAYYSMVSNVVSQNSVEIEYELSKYICLYGSGRDKCINECPLSNMFCRDHCSDKAIEYAKKDIEYAEQRVIDAKNKLLSLEESKKTWLINEVSGIDNDSKIS